MAAGFATGHRRRDCRTQGRAQLPSGARGPQVPLALRPVPEATLKAVQLDLDQNHVDEEAPNPTCPPFWDPAAGLRIARLRIDSALTRARPALAGRPITTPTKDARYTA